MKLGGKKYETNEKVFSLSIDICHRHLYFADECKCSKKGKAK